MPTMPRLPKAHAKYQDFSTLEKLAKREPNKLVNVYISDLVLETRAGKSKRGSGGNRSSKTVSQKPVESSIDSTMATRLAYVLSLAEDVFGDRKTALAFLKRRHAKLGATPLEKLETEWGGREVERLLLSAIHGLPA
jgi:Protein of unknown function (DUF2384)